MAEDPKLTLLDRCWGKMVITHNYMSLPEGMIKVWLLGAGFCVFFRTLNRGSNRLHPYIC